MWAYAHKEEKGSQMTIGFEKVKRGLRRTKAKILPEGLRHRRIEKLLAEVKAGRACEEMMDSPLWKGTIEPWLKQAGADLHRTSRNAILRRERKGEGPGGVIEAAKIEFIEEFLTMLTGLIQDKDKAQEELELLETQKNEGG